LGQLSRLLRSNLKFKHLQLLVSISERLHIGRVAEHLSLSQPAVSKSLAEIESIVGSQLFERTPSGLIETPEGKVFVLYARAALAQLGRLGDDLEAAHLGHAGTIQVGSVTAGSRLVPLAIELLKQRSPNTTVRLDEGLMEPLIHGLRLGELDLVIARVDTIPDPTGLALESVYQDSIVLVTAPGSSVLSQRKLTWSSLAQYPWVLPPPDSASRRRYDEALRQHGVGLPKDLVETGSFLAMLTLTRERSGICGMSEALARYCQRLGMLEILPLPPLALGSPVGIARLAGRRQRPAALLFSECFKEAVQMALPDRLVIS
jgi:DNA-binding transcriptional LysR family regulator